MGNKKRYENIGADVNTIKSLFNEMKNNLTFISERLDLTTMYFCDKLCRLTPIIQSLKSFTKWTFEETLTNYEKLIKNLGEVSAIYELKEYSQIMKSIEDLNSQQPATVVRCVLDINLFPNGSNRIFDKIDYTSLVYQMFTEYKIDFLDEDSAIISNLVNLNKEILLKNLRNKSRQLREAKHVFEGLSVLIMEANHAEKSVKRKTPIKSVLTNLLLKTYLHEMIIYIFNSFELNLYSWYELDHIFYSAECILNYLTNNNYHIASRFTNRLDDKSVVSVVRASLSYSQKMILDELNIFEGLKNAVKGLALISRYLKIFKYVKNPQDESLEKLRVDNRLKQFRNHKFFIDLSYETFTKEIHFELNEKEMILQSADLSLKQAVKVLNELKSVDISLRDGIHYPNEMIENLCKVIISNNLLISKIKKLTGEVKINLNMKKYKSIIPLLEIK
jgi:hypothetical protein